MSSIKADKGCKVSVWPWPPHGEMAATKACKRVVNLNSIGGGRILAYDPHNIWNVCNPFQLGSDLGATQVMGGKWTPGLHVSSIQESMETADYTARRTKFGLTGKKMWLTGGNGQANAPHEIDLYLCVGSCRARP